MNQILATIISIIVAVFSLYITGAPLWGILSTLFILLALHFRLKF